MTDRLQEIRERWESIQHDGSTTPWTHDDPQECVRSPNGRPVAAVPMYDERVFIAHAPADIAWLLAEIERRKHTV